MIQYQHFRSKHSINWNSVNKKLSLPKFKKTTNERIKL